MIEDYRKALLEVDTRLQEITEIIEGYEQYRREQKKPAVSIESTAYEAEAFGAD